MGAISAIAQSHYDLEKINIKTVKKWQNPKGLVKPRWLLWWLALAGFCPPAAFKSCLFPPQHLRPEPADCKPSFPEPRADKPTTAITFCNKKLDGVPAETKPPPILSKSHKKEEAVVETVRI